MGEEDGTITLFKASTARLSHTFKPVDSGNFTNGQRCLRSLVLLPNDAVCAGTADGSLRAYNLNSGEEVRSPRFRDH